MGRTQPEVLTSVRERIALLTRSGQTPVVVFDLDYTLFDNAPRVHAILRELATTHQVPRMLERLAALAPDDLPFDHRSSLAAAGVRDEPLLRKLKGDLGGLFFSSTFLDRDVPVAGAREFVEACLEGGAVVVYLTGRDHQGMRAGTVASLTAHGFPLGHPRVHLVMKPDQVTRDVEFKAGQRQTIRDYGELVAFFDNEPGNVNNFKEAFPQCIAVLVTTKHSPDPPPLRSDAERIATFEPDRSP